MKVPGGAIVMTAPRFRKLLSEDEFVDLVGVLESLKPEDLAAVSMATAYGRRTTIVFVPRAKSVKRRRQAMATAK